MSTPDDNQTEEKAEEEEKPEESNLRQEIEDIVKGFIIEKEILAQSHEEEINRMRNRFDRERKELLQQLEMEKEHMVEASRSTNAAANEVSFAVSESYVSDVGHVQNYSGAGIDSPMLNGFFERSIGRRNSLDEFDSNLIREIAEVYLRLNSGVLTAQLRPDLDLEDKYEKEREAAEKSFRLEKRELKRKLEDDCQRKLEQERINYEGSMADMKTIISDLQWQKRELESRLKHEREKWEMNLEREKNEIEKRCLQSLQEARRKLDEKHSNDLDKQRERYEENISDLQMDISKLTLQLKELNENLAQEKESIMIKFEREVKEMEQAFVEQRNSLRANFEAEFIIRLDNETSVFKSLNAKLKEELEAMEKDKQDLERKFKEERRKLEEKYEEEISEMEQRFSEEKRMLKMKLEEKYQLGLEREKGEMEETFHGLSEEIDLLKQENSKMEIMFNERKEELQRQMQLETEDMRRTMYGERDEIRARIENEFSQKFLLEKATQDDVLRQQERDSLVLRAKCDDLEMQLSSLRQERNMLIRNKEQLEGTLREKETALMNTNKMLSKSDYDQSRKLQETFCEKEKELASIKKENLQLELNLSAKRRENSDMQDEIVTLKRELSSAAEHQQYSVKFESDNSEMKSVQENMRRKNGEVSSLQREKHDLESRLSSLQRKNDELEDELATLRRKKLEVEDEISALKRDKTDSDHKIASLSKEKGEMEDLISSMKRKHGDLEESMSATKREKLELEHELSILKRHNKTMEIEVHRQFNDNEASRTPHHVHGHHERITPQVTKEVHYQVLGNSLYKDVDRRSDLKREVADMERMILDLKRERNDLESAIGRLTNEKADLEKDLRLQLEYRRKVLHQNADNSGNQGKGVTDATWILQRQKDDLQTTISTLKEQQVYLENKVSQYEMDCNRIEDKIDELKEHRATLESDVRSLKFEKHGVEKEIENRKKERRDGETKGGTSKVSGNSRLKSDYVHGDQSHEQELEDLRQEREELQTELANLKKQLILLQKELSTKNVNFSQESIQIDEKEVLELKKNRMQLEKGLAVIRRNKTEIEAEITIIKEVKSREENDLANLRRERMELDLQITALQSQKTRLEAEGSILKDERNRDEDEVDRLRREKADLEKDVYSLQSSKCNLETDISVDEDAWRKKARETTGLNEVVNDAEKHLRILQKQEESLQSELSRIKVIKNSEEEEVRMLHQEKKELEFQLSGLKREYQLKNQENEHKFNFDVALIGGVHSELNKRTKSDLQDEENLMNALRMQTENLQLEVSEIQNRKTEEEKELYRLRLEKSEIEAQLSELHRDKTEVENEITELRNEKQSMIFSRFQEPSEEFVPSGKMQRTNLTTQSYHTSQMILQNTQISSYNSDSISHNSQATDDVFYSSAIQPRFSQSPHTETSFEDLLLPSGTMKEDNDVISVKREREKIQSQVLDMRIHLAKLQTEVTELENRKTILETIQDRSTVDGLETGLTNGHISDLDLEQDSEMTTAVLEAKRDALIEEYENQIRTLKQEKLELEQKVSLLEWQQENMRQKLELQDISHRREISALNEKVRKNMSAQDSSELQADSLKTFYQRLSYFLMTGEHTSEEIMKEIEREITELANKSNSDYKNMKEFFTTTPTQKLEKEKQGSERENRAYSNQLRAQLEAADKQLKTCEKIIHRLYGENTHLNNQNVNLEGKLKSASRSQEKLQRKKVLLQKLVDKLGGHVGKDVLHQSYLVLELDKDVSL